MIDKALIKELTHIVGRNQVLKRRDQIAYARMDMSTSVEPDWPGLVLKVRTRSDLIRATRACISFKQPLLIRAAGTGKSGGAVPREHCVVIDIMGLNDILSIDKANLYAMVEPGVILNDLKKEVEAQGLFYPPDPASSHRCTIGGNVAENAGGPSALKYGCTRDYVLGGQAILGTGEVIDFGKHSVKGVTGYDIASLLCGSEGTLAVFCSLILRLLPLPAHEAVALFLFDDEEAALKGVLLVFAQGFRPRTLEYIDSTCLDALNMASAKKAFKKGQAALLIECDGSQKEYVVKELRMLKEILESRLGCKGEVADANRGHELWRLRAGLSEACTKYRGFKLSEDIALPLKELGSFSQWFKAKKDGDLSCGLFGHAGDGNLHVQIMFDSEQHMEKALSLRHQVLLEVINRQGTLTAEHGIGLQKRDYLGLEQASALIELQKRIKAAFDPYNLLNPNKIFAMR
ncbi:MAG TPA: FAD-binding oxidoreductase [Myxococcota bacterium]|nr:FAD-binding oxidoreductase [Myxococcota bacterium]